jgi:tetratricopeptide (TPR) repeat protein
MRAISIGKARGSRSIRGLLIFLVALLIAGKATNSIAAQNEESPAVQQLYAEAQAAESGGQLSVAIEKYRQILKLAPNLPAAHNNLGQLYYQQGQFAEAVPELQVAIKLDPRLVTPRALLGFSYYQMREFERSRDQLKLAAKLNPADWNVRVFLARDLISLGDVKQAEHLLEDLRTENPKNAEILYTLGSLYSSLAESTLGEIQVADPNSYLIEVLLAKVSEAKGLYLDAADHYKKAIERAPPAADLYYQYGHALWASKKNDAALAAYQQALRLNPYDYRASWEAGRIVLTQDPAEAVRLVSEALKLDPDLPEAWKIRGQALVALHRPQEAISNLKKSISLDPQDGSTHFQLARAYRQAGLLNEAVQEDSTFQKMQEQPTAGNNP